MEAVIAISMIFLIPLGFVLGQLYLLWDAKHRGVRWERNLFLAIDTCLLAGGAFFITRFSGAWYYTAVWIAGAVLLGIALIGWTFDWWNRRRLAVLLAAFALTGAARWGCAAYDRYIADITPPDSFDPYTYAPYAEDTRVCVLDEPSTLTIAEDPPHMDGATALYPVYSAFARAVYPRELLEDAEARFDLVSCSTTSFAYDAIIDGDVDILFVAGPSKEQEAAAAEAGVTLEYTPIGREAFVFFVHPDNPIEDVTIDQIRGIYSGAVTRWDQLGVSGLGGIRAFQRREGSGSQTALERFVMGDTPLMKPPTQDVLDAMGGMVTVVSSYQNHKNAIGYSFRFYCTELMSDFDIKLLRVNGVEPTLENIENGTYPLASYFYAVTRSDANAQTRALLDWILGEQGQSLIEQTGYTPLD